MTVIYLISKILTFPGALLHALWEHVMCRVFKCPVEDARYFNMNEMCGHVEHEFIEGKKQNFWFSFVPFILQLALGMGLMIPMSIRVIKFGNYNIGYILLLWLGISLLTNMFPLVEDALQLWDTFYGENGAGMLTKILLFPFIGIFVGGAYLERFGITLLTSLAAAWFWPEMYAPIAGFIVDFYDVLTPAAETASQTMG